MWFSPIRIQLLDLLGEGAQGRVFRAKRLDRKSGLSQIVAIKILHSETAVELWTKEFESLQRVRSPYCVQVYAFERVLGRPALVLEFVDGLSLSELGRIGLLDADDVREIIAQIEAGLLELQAQDSCHGDLSPGNVLVDRAGRIRLLDFGLANQVGLRGTPEFTAPERFCGKPPSLATDLFSLGKIEHYLRGPGAIDDVNSYLTLNPHAREPRRVSPETRQQSIIAGKIKRWLDQRERTTTLVTQNLQAAPKVRPKTGRARVFSIAGLSVACAFLGPSQALQPHHAIEVGQLVLATKAWSYFELDHRALGYAPQTVTLKAGVHTLKYTTARTRGEMRVTLQPGQSLKLGDADLAK